MLRNLFKSIISLFIYFAAPQKYQLGLLDLCVHKIEFPILLDGSTMKFLNLKSR